MKTLLSIQEVRMVLRKFMVIGLLLTTERLTVCLHATVFYLIMNHREGEERLSQER